jgi:hypothetical protein
MSDPLIQRWDDLIAAVRARYQAMLDDAAAGSEPLIEEITTDLTPLVLPWNTMGPRLRAACEEISDGWNRISDEMSASGRFSHEALRAEGTKRDLATCELELLHERVYGGVMARAADRMRARALATDAAAHACQQCGGPLDKVAPVSQSLNVACGHCRFVNTVHPGDALRAFAAIGAMHLAAEEARPHGEAMRRVDTRIKQVRDAKDVPLAMLVELEAASRAYWTTRLDAEARYDPAQARYTPAKLDRYLKDTLKTLRRYWQWREHESAVRA